MSTTSRASSAAPRLNGLAAAIGVALFYTIGMGVIWLLTRSDDTDGYPSMRSLLLPLAVLGLLTITLAWWGRTPLQRSSKVGVFGLLGLAIIVLPLLDGVLAAPWSALGWGTLGAIALGTLLVGIGEEVAFRGLILNALLPRFTVVGAVIGSAVLFGLLHSVNVLIVSPASTVAIQVVLTTIFGIAAGWVYVLTGGNLTLLIIIHWLYDFGVFAATESGSDTTLGLLVPVVTLVVAIVLTVMGIRRARGRRQLISI